MEFQGFSHPALMNHKTMWMLDSVPNLENFVFVIKDEADKFDMVNEIISDFTNRVLSARPNLEKGLYG